ncbi:MAG TPA: hypothetical protein PKL17_06320 [Pseudomonadota bacterium]|nr:hypothetical protein [Pseudomonadota bacterium]
MSDFEQEQGDAHSGGSAFDGLSAPVNHYDISGTEKSQGGYTPSYQSWDAWGYGAGNRKNDTPQVDPKKPDAPGTVKNSTMGAPSVDQVNLSDLKVPADQRGPANGFYDESVAGTVPWKEKWGSGKYNKDGTSADLWSGSTVAGARRQAGLRGGVSVEGDYGKAEASGDLYANAEAGVGANAKVTNTGVEAGAQASARAGIGVRGDANLTSADGRLASMDGIVTDPLNAGVGAHADGFAGVKVGAGVKAGIGEKFTGIEGKIGGFAGAEGSADIHANLGPLKGKAGVSGIAGIGFEASGGISLEDWKLHIGGKLGAALGLGGSVSFDATLDLKQTAQLAMWAGKQIHNGLDRDGDGKLSLNDAAKGVGELAQGGANLLDKGWDGAQKLLDGDKDGKFTFNDVKIRAGQAKDWLASKGSQALGWAGDQVNAAGKALHNMADRDGDGKIGIGDLVAGAAQAKEFAKDKIGQAGQALGNAKDWALDKAKQAGTWLKKSADRDGDGKLGIGDVLTGIGEVKNFAGEKMHQLGGALGAAKDWAADKAGDAKDWLLDKAANAGKALHNAADRDGDGKLGFSDIVAGMGQAKDWASDKASAAGKAIGNAAGAAKDWIGDKASAAGKALHNAADRDGDGKLGWGDVVAGAGQAKNWLGDKAASAGKALGAAKDWASDKASAAGKALHNAADRDGDGKLGWGDVVAGAGQAKEFAGNAVNTAGKALGAAKDWASDKASAAWDGAKSAGKTLVGGLSSAASTVGGTFKKAKDFFGGW